MEFLLVGLGGALGWFVYLAVQLLPMGSIPAAFAAAAAIAVFSECMARLRRCLRYGAEAYLRSMDSL